MLKLSAAGYVWSSVAAAGVVAAAGITLAAVTGSAGSAGASATPAESPTASDVIGTTPAQAAKASTSKPGNGNGNNGNGNGGGGGNGSNGNGVPVTVSAAPVSGLAPGGRVQTLVRVATSNGAGGTVRTIRGTVTAASLPAGTACAWQDIVVEPYDASVPGAVAYTVSSSSPAQVPVYVKMQNTNVNQDACKQLIVTVTYSVTAQG